MQVVNLIGRVVTVLAAVMFVGIMCMVAYALVLAVVLNLAHWFGWLWW